jgi:hypothetical protein
MTWPGLTQDVEHWLFKKYALLPTKIAESDTVSLGHGLCESGGTHPFTIRTPAKTHSLLALTMIDPENMHSLV